MNAEAITYYNMPEFKDVDRLLGDRIAKNSHAVVSIFKHLMRPRKISEGHYARLSVAGKLGLCHYNAGLYCIQLRTNISPIQVDGKTKYEYVVQFHIGNLDDMSWDAWSKYFETKEEADALVEKMAPLLDDLVELPTNDELNDLLQPFGLYGEFQP